jgi:hypothetical protein
MTPRAKRTTTPPGVEVVTYPVGSELLPTAAEPVTYGTIPGMEPSAILADYSDEFGLVHVVVLRSHDGLYEGEVHALPNCQRTAGLIEAGFVDVVVAPITMPEVPR